MNATRQWIRRLSTYPCDPQSIFCPFQPWIIFLTLHGMDISQHETGYNSVVTQTVCLLCRRTGSWQVGRFTTFSDSQIANLRYGRLPACATVAQTVCLLCRRLAVGRPGDLQRSPIRRLPICDTAGCQPALWKLDVSALEIPSFEVILPL